MLQIISGFRRKFEKKEHQKLNEIHSIAERLYTIRYDRSRDMQHSIVEIKVLNNK